MATRAPISRAAWISPPQHSDSSSGCGATTSTVSAGRMCRRSGSSSSACPTADKARNISMATHRSTASLYAKIPSLAGQRARLAGVTLAPRSTEQLMATIVGGIATSHTPTIGFALDAKKQQDPVWAPIFAGYEPVRQWLAAKQPDVLFFVYNDHITSFFFDHYSHFALGVGAKYWVADEGGGARKLPPIAGHPALARHVATGLTADEFDLSFF